MRWGTARPRKMKLQESCCVTSQSSLQPPEALKGKLISSLAVLATSSLPLRETNPFTADVITASCSSCAGTHKPGLSGAGRGPREAPGRKHFPVLPMVWRTEVRGAKLLGKENWESRGLLILILLGTL